MCDLKYGVAQWRCPGPRRYLPLCSAPCPLFSVYLDTLIMLFFLALVSFVFSACASSILHAGTSVLYDGSRFTLQQRNTRPQSV